jgi:hypothetical protein
MGIPNPRFIQAFQQRQPLQMPDWSLQAIETTGQGTDPEIATAQGKLRAARAAEMDARRKLAERIHGLRISSETTVNEFVTQRDHIESLVDAVVVDAYVKDTKFSGDMAEVTIILPGARVWEVVGEEVRRRSR